MVRAVKLSPSVRSASLMNGFQWIVQMLEEGNVSIVKVVQSFAKPHQQRKLIKGKISETIYLRGMEGKITTCISSRRKNAQICRHQLAYLFVSQFGRLGRVLPKNMTISVFITQEQVFITGTEAVIKCGQFNKKIKHYSCAWSYESRSISPQKPIEKQNILEESFFKFFDIDTDWQ